RGVCAVHLAHLHRLGAADLLLLLAAAGRFRPPASTHHAALHSPDGHLHAPVRDVRGGAALRPPLLPLLPVGEVREEQRRSGGILFPNEERPAVAVYPRAPWRE